ncbi:hypothetical protein ES703_29459 [subsurface metagenome]
MRNFTFIFIILISIISCNDSKGLNEPMKYNRINDFMETNEFIQSLGPIEIGSAIIIIVAAMCAYEYFNYRKLHKKWDREFENSKNQ